MPTTPPGVSISLCPSAQRTILATTGSDRSHRQWWQEVRVPDEEGPVYRMVL